MREEIKNSLDGRLKNHLCTLKKASLDKSNPKQKKYMCHSQIEVVDFDKVPNQYSKGRGWSGVPKSNDALYVDANQEWYFIEFKNGEVVKDDVYRKLYDSLIMLLDWGIIPNWDYIREHVSYILVYNSEHYDVIPKAPSREQNYGYIRNLASEEAKLFDIHKFEKYLFKKTHTYTKELFEENFVLPMELEEGLS